MSSSTTLAVDEQWSRVVDFYNEVSPQHCQEPMKALMTAINKAGMKTQFGRLIPIPRLLFLLAIPLPLTEMPKALSLLSIGMK